jgi:hypothetical protein
MTFSPCKSCASFLACNNRASFFSLQDSCQDSPCAYWNTQNRHRRTRHAFFGLSALVRHCSRGESYRGATGLHKAPKATQPIEPLQPTPTTGNPPFKKNIHTIYIHNPFSAFSTATPPYVIEITKPKKIFFLKKAILPNILKSRNRGAREKMLISKTLQPTKELKHEH